VDSDRQCMRRIYFVILLLLAFNTISTEASDRLPLQDGWLLIGCVGGSLYSFDSLPPKDTLRRFVRHVSDEKSICCLQEVASLGFECIVDGEENYTILHTFSCEGAEIDAVRIPEPKDDRRIIIAHKSTSGKMVAVVVKSYSAYREGAPIGNTGYRQGFTQKAMTPGLPTESEVTVYELYILERNSIDTFEYPKESRIEIGSSSLVWESRRDALVYSDTNQRIVEMDPADGSVKILCEGDSPSRIPGTDKILFRDKMRNRYILDLQTSDIRRIPIPSNILNKLGIQDFIPLPNGSGYFIIAGSPFGIGGEWGLYDNSVSYWFLSTEGKASRLGGGRRIAHEYCFCPKQIK
jgi:hypothetical protein